MNNTTVLIHRYLLYPKQGEIVDHINNNPLDNRILNLRICNDTLNSHNKQIKEGTYRGVSKNGKNFAAKIAKDGKQYNLGTFKTQKEAAKAYDKKAKELYENEAKTNFEEEIEPAIEPLISNKRIKENSTSKYRGVSITKSGKTFQAQITKGKTFHIGTFKTEEDAAKAYDIKAIELYGEQAKLNFP